jgi:hypothetical protein
MRAELATVCFSSFFVAPAIAQVGPKDTDRILHLELSRQGWADYQRCPGGFLCAAAGDPYRYHFYSAKDISGAAITAIQDVGFSFRPDSSRPNFSECKNEPKNSAGGKPSFFWTDYIPLDDAFLMKIDVKWEQLKILHDSSTFYQVRVVGCYQTVADGETILAMDPKTIPSDLFQVFARTEIKLIMRIDLQYRGLKSGFVDVPTSVYPKPILDVIAKDIETQCDSVNSDEVDLRYRDRG